MTNQDIASSTTTNLETELDSFSVASVNLDSPSSLTETEYVFGDAAKHNGYYLTIPQFKNSVNAFVLWAIGRGWEADTHTTNNLKIISGWGEDSFDSILQNLLINKKVQGDAFAEIIREGSTIINLKPLNTAHMKIVTNRKGIIIRYEHSNGKSITKFDPKDIFHLCNDRIGDQIHGTSILSAATWIIDAKQEAIETYRKIMKRALALGVLKVDTDDADKLNDIKGAYKDAVNKGEVLVLPEGVADLEDSKVTVQDFITWMNYLDNIFFQTVGIPANFLGGNEAVSEGGQKVGYLSWEQVYITEQRLLEQDIEAQLGWTITFIRPVSLKDNIQENEEKNTSQIGFQPKDTEGSVERE